MAVSEPHLDLSGGTLAPEGGVGDANGVLVSAELGSEQVGVDVDPSR